MLAARGRLSDPAVLTQQVSPHAARSAVEGAGGQLRRSVAAHAERAPGDAQPGRSSPTGTRTSVRRSSGRPSSSSRACSPRTAASCDLLTANYTFLDEQLARHYGIPGVYGGHFRRVTLPDGSPRGGLLGQGSILMVTSYADRTSPVLRGKWLLENLLGTPPPPPPPDVPPLDESTERARRRMPRCGSAWSSHRTNPQCAACHARMDPLGFALENFDAIGVWRTTEVNKPIDASGELPDGTKILRSTELKRCCCRAGTSSWPPSRRSS